MAEANRLAEESKQLGKSGKTDEAIGAAERGLAIKREVLGNDDLDVAACLQCLAALRETKEDFPAARQARQEVLAIKTKALGSEHWRVLDARVALDHLALLEKLSPAQRRQVAEAERLQQQVEKQYAARQFNEAMPEAKQAVAVRRELLGEKDPDLGTSLCDLADLNRGLGDFPKAASLYAEGAEIYRRALGERHPDYAATLNDLGLAYWNTGNFAAAKQAYSRALDIHRQLFGENHHYYADDLNYLAELYRSLGDYAKAEPLYRQALAIDHKLNRENDVNHAATVNNLALLYHEMGDHAKAEDRYHDAAKLTRAIVGEQSYEYAQCLNNLAGLYSDIGAYAKAEPLYLRALEIQTATIGVKHPDHAVTLTGLAQLYSNMGDFAKAEPPTREALAIWKDLFGEMNPDYAQGLLNLAWLMAQRGDFAAADPLARQASNTLKETLGDQHPRFAWSLACLALIEEGLGEQATAKSLSLAALQIASRQLEATAAVQSERQQLNMTERVRIYLDHYLSMAVRIHPPPEEMYREVLAWKGAVSARQLALRRLRNAVAGGKSPEIARMLDELVQCSTELANIAQQIPAVDKRAAYRTKLSVLSNRVEQLQRSLTAAGGDFAWELSQQHRTPAELQRVLPAGVAVVDFLDYNYCPLPMRKGEPTARRETIAFIIRRDQPIQWIDLCPAENISNAIDSWRRDFGRRDPGSKDPDAGAALRQYIWDRLEPALRGATTILVSPDGSTARLPWPALPGKKPGTYLIDEVAIGVVPIPRLLPELLAEDGKAESPDRSAPALMLVGDVDFGADPGTIGLVASSRSPARVGHSIVWPALPGTREEVAAIESTFRQRYKDLQPTLLTGNLATKSAVRRAAGRFDYLHFSTHGFFAPPETKSATAPNSRAAAGAFVTSQDVTGFHPGLLSGLVLAGANRPVEEGKDDGILTALEVEQMDLSRVKLATLSACETGLGQTAGGEGLLGLQRAFQIAGAKTVVAGLWRVPDRATQLLMARFYDNLWQKKMSKLEALREAQRWLLHEGPKEPRLVRGLQLAGQSDQPDRSDGSGLLPPFYWAAFVPSGDWR